ncbi:hypothetical protein F2Q70_00031653 [Brassica cretica]|uniref:C2H2-type domain-containing protein n=1 Tax=Brassica cretica TaxID=69181 RepID=A0A8S9FQ79_BRACR|nr:hypothetical protein F2Q70_00031653 [Brassica cretica]
MDDVKDKLKGFMKKVNLSSSSGKFKGSGRVLGSSSSAPVNPIQNRFNPPQSSKPKPNPNQTPRPTKPSPSPSPSPSAALPEKPVSSGSQKKPDPDPVRAPPQDGFDPFGAFITSSNRSQNGYSLNMFECPICGNPFKTEEEVSVHVESCLGEDTTTNGDEASSEEKDKSEVEKLVVVYLSGKPSESSVDVLLRLLKNIVKEPENGKFRKIRMSNAKIKEAIGDVAGGVELLELVGFELKEENDEIWAVMDVPGGDQTQLINEVVGMLEKRKIEMSRKDEVLPVEPVAAAPKKIDREIRVFFSVAENVASKIEVPDSFYSLSADEIKREADLRRKKIAESQLLIPRSYKEKQAKAARKRYKRSMIRVQFPDGVVLQGVFAPWEPTFALYEDEELVPSALIKFRPIETASLVYTGLCNELLEISEPLT